MNLQGVGTLIRFRLRADRLTVALWAVGLAALWGGSAAAVGDAFDDQGRTELVALLVSNPALLLMRGAPSGTGAGAVLFVSVFNYVALLVAIMAVLTAVRHTRGDAEANRDDLVGATAVGRVAPLTATLLAGLLEVLVVAAAVGAASLAAGLDATGSALTLAGLVGVGGAFLGVGSLAGAAMPTARAANGCGTALAGLAFVVRGVGDATGEVAADASRVVSGGLSWASPIGWITQVRPFADPPWSPDPRPLLLYIPTVVVLVVVALAVDRRRDVGASLLTERPGRASAGAVLSGPLGLAVRLQRGSAVAWVVAAGVLGGLAGAAAPSLSTNLAENETVSRILRTLGGITADDMVATFLAAIAGIVAILACAAAVQGAMRLRHEELSRGETALAAPLRRSWVLLGWLLVATICGIAVVLAFTLAAGIGLTATGAGDRTQVMRIGLTMLPVVVVYAAVTALLLAWAPRTLPWLAWLLLLVPMLAGEFVPLFGPDLAWVADVSPFHWLPNPLAADPDLGPSAIMVAAAAGASALAVVGIRRRDVTV